MRKNALTILSVIAIALLIVSQIVWVRQLMRRDKDRFAMELKQTLQSVVAFSLSKEVSRGLNELNFELIPLDSAHIPENAVVKGSFDTKEYQSDKNLGNFLVGVFAEDLLEENKITLEPIDSLFRKEFAHYSEISAYSMRILKQDSTMREMYVGAKASSVLNDITSGVTVKIPMGKTNTYIFGTHVVLKPTVFTQQLRSIATLSAVAVILISILLLNQLLQLRRKSAELDAHKMVVRGIVHDLKSPLAYVFTMLDSFENSEIYESEKKKYFTAKIRVKHLSKKIEILLSTLRNEKNKLHIQPDTFNITQNCLNILRELNVVYRAKNISYTIHPDNDLLIKVDPIYFEACLRNLLDNAVKYASDNVKIDLSFFLKDNEFFVSIADNGKGIAPNDRKKVFREFYRSDNDSSLKSHGVGLAFSKQIVQAHSGKIVLESCIGKGSIFTIIIPQ